MIALCAWALPVLSRSESSAIVNVSSGLAFTPKADAVVYCATKAAVHNFSQGLRYQMEDANNGVSVTEVMPPLVATEMTAGRQDGAISADQVASEVLEGLKRDQQEIRVGKVKLLAALMRLSPSLAAKILRNS